MLCIGVFQCVANDERAMSTASHHETRFSVGAGSGRCRREACPAQFATQSKIDQAAQGAPGIERVASGGGIGGGIESDVDAAALHELAGTANAIWRFRRVHG